MSQQEQQPTDEEAVMRTEDGEEIIEPGTYEQHDGPELHVFLTGNPEVGYELWACTAYDHGPFCRLCQEVDSVTNACLVNVLDGRMTCRQKPTGEFTFKMTQAGRDAVDRPA